MANVLNLALKKDVFEGLLNGATNQIVIEKTNWWKKRLMDLDTGRFKDFSTAIVSSGSSDKIEYTIEKIELIENNFVISVVLPDVTEQEVIDEGDSDFEDEGDSDFELEETQEEEPVEPIIVEPEKVEPVIVEPIIINTGIDKIEQTFTVKKDGTLEEPEVVESVTVNPVVVNEDGSITQKSHYVLSEEQKKKIIEKYTQKVKEESKPADVQPENEEKDVKAAVLNLISKFCELKDVYVVNMPNVTIRNNGQIFGCKRRLIADRESDVKFNFVKKEFIKNPWSPTSVFLLGVLEYLNGLLKNNYVFINKNACGFRTDDTGNVILTIYAIGKRKYFFAK